MVSLLLANMGIEVNKPDDDGTTPFHIACQNDHNEVVSLLLPNMGIDINKPSNIRWTPLWIASLNSHLSVVQLILASGREVDTQTKSIADWNHKTDAEVARYQGTRDIYDDESDEDYTNAKQNGQLIDSFDADPATTRHQLRAPLHQ